jgi:hypothetical protein
MRYYYTFPLLPLTFASLSQNHFPFFSWIKPGRDGKRFLGEGKTLNYFKWRGKIIQRCFKTCRGPLTVSLIRIATSGRVD